MGNGGRENLNMAVERQNSAAGMRSMECHGYAFVTTVILARSLTKHLAMPAAVFLPAMLVRVLSLCSCLVDTVRLCLF